MFLNSVLSLAVVDTITTAFPHHPAKDVHPWNLCICYRIWDQRDSAELGVIKLRILRWEDYPGFSEWA